MVYNWPSARGWVGRGSSETQEVARETQLYSFPSLANIHRLFYFSRKPCQRVSAQALFPTANPVGLPSKKSVEFVHFSPSAGTLLAQAIILFHLADLDQGTGLLPASTLSSLYSTRICPWLPPLAPTAWAPAHWPPHGSSDLPGTSFLRAFALALLST